MDVSNLSDEVKAKARECKSQADLLKLAEEEGIELSEEQLDKIAGGEEWNECGQDGDCNFLHDW